MKNNIKVNQNQFNFKTNFNNNLNNFGGMDNMQFNNNNNINKNAKRNWSQNNLINKNFCFNQNINLNNNIDTTMIEHLNHTIKNNKFVLNPVQKKPDDNIISFASKTVKNRKEYDERSRIYLLKKQQLNNKFK